MITPQICIVRQNAKSYPGQTHLSITYPGVIQPRNTPTIKRNHTSTTRAQLRSSSQTLPLKKLSSPNPQIHRQTKRERTHHLRSSSGMHIPSKPRGVRGPLHRQLAPPSVPPARCRARHRPLEKRERGAASCGGARRAQYSPSSGNSAGGGAAAAGPLIRTCAPAVR